MPFSERLVPQGAKTASLDTFGQKVYPITPSDSADVVNPVNGEYFKYIVAKGTGDVSVLGYGNLDGDTPQVITVAAGQVLPGRIRRVLSTGTTAAVCGWSD